ncbi:hypothetical protein [Lysobacter gummosus]
MFICVRYNPRPKPGPRRAPPAGPARALIPGWPTQRYRFEGASA